MDFGCKAGHEQSKQDFTFTVNKKLRTATPVVKDEGNWPLKEIRNIKRLPLARI
jgi:hypothetical protein